MCPLVLGGDGCYLALCGWYGEPCILPALHTNHGGATYQQRRTVTGTINGQTVIAKIRVDNVGITKDATGKFLFNLVEAKYSVSEVTVNNVRQTLTPQQKLSEDIVVSGKDVRFFIRGEGSAVKLNTASNGNLFNKDQEITGNISQLSIVAPGATNTTGNQLNNNNNATNNLQNNKKP